jgi:hypothetical protein
MSFEENRDLTKETDRGILYILQVRSGPMQYRFRIARQCNEKKTCAETGNSGSFL